MTKLPPLGQRGILITGCSTGIGRHCALRLHARGYQVVATARNLDDIADMAAMGIKTLKLDVTNDNEIHMAVSYFQEQNLPLYALFNNAGFGQPGAVEDLNRHTMQKQFDTNVFGSLQLIHEVMPIMRTQGFGRIIQNTSILGFVAMPYRGAYNASKFALEGLSDTLRLELVDTEIKTIIIEPGPITSKFRDNAYQHFLANIDKKHSAHADKYAQLEARLANSNKEPAFTLGPEAVYSKLLKALEKNNPRARYTVTTPTWVLAYLKRILPDCLLDKILRVV